MTRSVPAIRAGGVSLRPLLALGFLAPAAPAAAQSLRDFSYERGVRGEQQLRAVVEFGAGRLTLRPGSSERLYALTLRYDAERFQPVGSYDADAREVRLGVAGLRRGGVRVGRRDALPQVALVELSPSVPLSLDILLGAAESRIELGGLTLTDLSLKTGASRTHVSFASPGRGACRTAYVSSGAGELEMHGLGNSGCRRWVFDGGVGAVTLDLGGEWKGDARFVMRMALGGTTIRVPRGLGVRVTVDGFLAGFEGSGFRKREGVWYSPDYESAKRKVEVEMSGALGGLKVEWRE